MVPYRLAYGQRPTTVIEFWLEGDDLRPDEITAASGVLPFMAWAKGDSLPSGRARRSGAWALDPACSRDEDFSTQLQRLLDRLEALPPILHEFVRRFDAGIGVGYSAGATNRNFGFHIDRRTIERLATLRLSLDLDLYPICEGEEDDGTESALDGA